MAVFEIKVLHVEMGNTIYSLFIKHISTGQTIGEGKNTAKDNDYIIYTTPTTNKQEQQDYQLE